MIEEILVWLWRKFGFPTATTGEFVGVTSALVKLPSLLVSTLEPAVVETPGIVRPPQVVFRALNVTTAFCTRLGVLRQ
jgi:hypothetical protein